jgi:hypothetical protein
MVEVQICEVSLDQQWVGIVKHCWVSMVTSHTILADVTIDTKACNFTKSEKERRNVFYSHHHQQQLDSPSWALGFLRSFCQLKYPAVASSDFATRAFSRVGLSAPRPTPRLSRRADVFCQGCLP